MKNNYENVTRYYLPRRTHCVIRLDGKAFHSYTKRLEKPYSLGLAKAMADAAVGVMDQIQGSVFAYQQSDEISILVTDFNTIKTEAPFAYNIQKLASISASVMSVNFNHWMHYRKLKTPEELGYFDARVFSIPERIEVYNYFLWRQRDCIRNSIMSLGQTYFSHSELHGLSISEIQDKLMLEKNVNWSKELSSFKNGVIIYPSGYSQGVTERFSQNNDLMNLIPVRQD